MRPVDKGMQHKTYERYQDASKDLTNRLGFMCSYCEMNISNLPAVEHVKPKSKNPALKNKWSNFLISCTYCNSAKSDRNDDRKGYFFPDECNTAYIFRWSKDKVVEPNASLSISEKLIAENTIDLLKLNLTSLQARKLNRKTNRENLREQAWSTAELQLDYFKQICSVLAKKDNADELIRKCAKSIAVGIDHHVSIYMKVFEDEPVMLNEIINCSKGIRKSCFQADGKPKQTIGIDKEDVASFT